jgi:putative transposase
VLRPDFRLIASVRYIDHGGGMLGVVQAALHDFAKAGGQVRRVLLDRGFYTFQVLSWLKAQGLTAIVPLRLGSRQRKKWERGNKAYVTEHTLRDSRGEVDPLPLAIHVVVRYQRGRKWGKHGCQYLIFAVLGEVPLAETDTIYRRRFGIETSYRMIGQALARTTSRRPALRLLHMGVAALLHNEWVILKLLWASEGRQGPKGFVVVEELLRFEDLLNHLARAISYRLGEKREVVRRRRLPHRLSALQEGLR